ncbi:MAG: lactate utilization protein [Patescibacteria group bacterium]|nr:LUD domain-containing protein [Patescibacteria group bacterium]MDE1945959.1 lactate utilization protein [Patescibacteria group bacterium]
MDYSTIASDASIVKTIAALSAKGYDASIAASRADALEEIKKLIPADASVMNGSSATLGEIGYLDYLAKGGHGWRDLHAEVTAENDAAKRVELRKQSVLSDWYLGSVHALAETGDMVVASNSGSQLPHLVFTSKNIILVIGAQKIVPDLAEGMKRLESYVVPLEDARMMQAYKTHTANNKTLVIRGENPSLGRKFHIMIVKEKLGF